jgi:hypothetical protein
MAKIDIIVLRYKKQFWGNNTYASGQLVKKESFGEEVEWKRRSIKPTVNVIRQST